MTEWWKFCAVDILSGRIVRFSSPSLELVHDVMRQWSVHYPIGSVLLPAARRP